MKTETTHSLVWDKQFFGYYNNREDVTEKFKNWVKDVRELVTAFRKSHKGTKLVSHKGDTSTQSRPTLAQKHVSINSRGGTGDDFDVDLREMGNYYNKLPNENSYLADGTKSKFVVIKSFTTRDEDYDVLVKAALIRIVEYFPDTMEIRSNQTEDDWKIGAEFAKEVFGIGAVPFSKEAQLRRRVMLMEEEVIAEVSRMFNQPNGRRGW